MMLTETRSTHADVPALRGTWLFSACSESELRAISALCTPVVVPAGQALIHEGDPDTGCLVVTRGQAVVERAGRMIGHAVGGSILGVEGLVEHCAPSTTVFALTDMQVLAIDRQALAEFLARGGAWSVAHRL